MRDPERLVWRWQSHKIFCRRQVRMMSYHILQVIQNYKSDRQSEDNKVNPLLPMLRPKFTHVLHLYPAGHLQKLVVFA